MNIFFYDTRSSENPQYVKMDAVPRQGEEVLIRGRYYVVESVEWLPNEERVNIRIRFIEMIETRYPRPVK